METGQNARLTPKEPGRRSKSVVQIADYWVQVARNDSFRVANYPLTGLVCGHDARPISSGLHVDWKLVQAGLLTPPSWIGRTPCPQCGRRRRVHGFSCLESAIADMELGLNLRHIIGPNPPQLFIRGKAPKRVPLRHPTPRSAPCRIPPA